MKYTELYRLLQRYGWELREGKRKGGHDKLVHPDFKHSIIIGRHKTQEVPPGTLRQILRDAGIKP